MLTVAHYFLFMDILMAILAPISLIGNGFILTIILANHNLRKNEGLYLLVALSLADFLLALFILPFIVFLIISWASDSNVSYDATKMLLFNLPVVCEIKINSVLTVAIAFDRFAALQWPVSYFKFKQRSLYACGATAVGVVWAIFDVVLDLSTANFVAKPGCAAAGCFMSTNFRYYWGVSDMFINGFAMAITAFVLLKLRIYKTVQPAAAGRVANFNSNNNNNNNNNIQISNPNNAAERAKFVHANYIAISVLFCSGVCVFLPSLLGGVGEMAGLTAFTSLGPFVAVGLLACGVGNAFIFGVKHTVIRQAIRTIWNQNGDQQTTTSRIVILA